MKQLTFLLLAGLLLVSGGCKRTGTTASRPESARSARLAALLAEYPSYSEAKHQPDDINEYIRVTHRWKDPDLSCFIGRRPSEAEIDKWKEQFEQANPKDSVWRTEFRYCRDENRYMAVHDFIELSYSYNSRDVPQDDRRTQWRLLQYDPDPERRPAGEFSAVRYIRTLYEEMLDYIRGSQWDINLGADLDADMRAFYQRILSDAVCRHAGQPIQAAVRKESAAITAYDRAAGVLFAKVDGMEGSSSPYRTAQFRIRNIEGRIRDREALLFALTEDAVPQFLPDTRITEADVEREYETFAATFRDDAYSTPAAERRAALEQERRAWKRWMTARAEVSRLLDGNPKTTFDQATRNLRRDKLILLKNRCNIPGYLSASFEALLLSEDNTDEEILAHHLETLAGGF